jgi:hypothetical protein
MRKPAQRHNFLLINFIISFSSGSLTLSELGPVPLHLLKGCLETVLVFIYLQLSKMILSFRYMFWYRTVRLFGLGFRDETIQKYSPSENTSTSFLPLFLAIFYGPFCFPAYIIRY